jgi:hypothetical protein
LDLGLPKGGEPVAGAVEARGTRVVVDALRVTDTVRVRPEVTVTFCVLVEMPP